MKTLLTASLVLVTANLYPLLGAQLGQKLWEFETGGGNSSPAIVADGTVYVGSDDNKVHALNGRTGQKVWEFSTGASVDSSPAIGAGGTVYVGSFDRKIYALDGATGQKKWEFVTGDYVHSSPAVGTNGTVYVGSDDRNVYALDGVTGEKLWEFPTGDQVFSSPALGPDGTVYVGSSDNKVYALDGPTGQKLWDFPTGGSVNSSPAIGSNGTVYVGSYDTKVYALDGATGQKLWEFATGGSVHSSPAIGADGIVYVGSIDKKLYALSGATGQKLWDFPTGDNVYCSPAVAADGTVYVGSNDRKLYALDRAEGSELLARQSTYAADMHLAQLALEQNNRPLAISLLNKCRPAGMSETRKPKSGAEITSRPSVFVPDLRGWEWRYLWQLCQGDESLTLHRYPGGIEVLAVSKDGKVLAVATYNEVALWDLPTKQPWSALPIRGAAALSFSPTANLLAVGTWNDRREPVVELWDLHAGKPAKVHSYPTGNHSLAFSPDGKLLASFDSAGSVRIIDWASGQHLCEFEVAPLRESWAGVVEFSPDGRQLAVGGDFGLLRLFDLQTRTFMTNQTKGAESVNSLAFSPASDLLAAGLGYGEGTIGLWDTRSGAVLGELTNHTDYVHALAFTTDGRELLSASRDGTIRVWSVADRVQLRRLQSTGEGFSALALLPDGRTLVSGGVKGSVRFWDAVAINRATSHTNLALWEGFESLCGLERRAFEAATLDPRVVQRLGLTFTADSSSFIVTDQHTGVLVRWDARSWRRVENLAALGSNHWAVALSPDERWLATGDCPARVTVWDWTTRQAVTNFPVSIEVFGVLRFSHSGHYLIALTLSNGLKISKRVWGVGSGVEVSLTGGQFDGLWGMVDVSPDDRLLAAGFANGAVKLFRLPSLELVKELGHHK